MIRILTGFMVSIALHLLLGWAWTIGGGIAVGLYRVDRAWLMGGISVGFGWAVFVAHAFLVSPEPTMRLLGIMGAIFGDVPGIFILIGTILVGILLGIAGGALGASMNPILTPLLHRLMPGIFQPAHSVPK